MPTSAARFLATSSTPGRVAVEPMDELEELRVRARGAQLLDHAEARCRCRRGRRGRPACRARSARRPRTGSADRSGAAAARGECASRRGGPDRRNAELVADREPGVGLHPLAVDPNLAAAQDPVDVALGHALQHLAAGNCRRAARRRPRPLQASSQHPCLNHSFPYNCRLAATIAGSTDSSVATGPLLQRAEPRIERLHRACRLRRRGRL